eukprot:4194838-Alexandrium_andersonii.AAC.1
MPTGAPTSQSPPGIPDSPGWVVTGFAYSWRAYLSMCTGHDILALDTAGIEFADGKPRLSCVVTNR